MSERGPRASIQDGKSSPVTHETTHRSPNNTTHRQRAVDHRRNRRSDVARQDSLRPHVDEDAERSEETDGPALSPSAAEFDSRLKSLSYSADDEDLTQRVVEEWDADWSARRSPLSSLGYREDEVVPPSNATLRVSGNPHERRGNPKIARVRTPRPESRIDPDPKPVWDVQQERASTIYEQRAQLPDGSPLYRLSDTVPYVLGSREYVDGIMALNNFFIPPIVPQDDQGNDVFQKDLVTRKDKALLVILMFAGQPAGERTSIVQHCLAPFTLPNACALQCWKDNGAEPPAPLTLSFKDFAVLIRDWQDSAPFFTITITDPDERAIVIARWSTVLTLLRERDINLEKITQSLFTELTSLTSQSAIEAKLASLQTPPHKSTVSAPHTTTTTTTAPRTKKRERPGPSAHRAPVSTTDGPSPAPSAYKIAAYTRGTFDYVTEEVKDPRLPYAHRFSHGSPQGELFYQDQSRAFDSYYDGPASSPARVSVRAILSERKTKFNKSPFAKGCKWLFMALVGAGVIGAILLICLFKVMGRKKGFVEQ